jgi:hypothetical protein
MISTWKTKKLEWHLKSLKIESLRLNKTRTGNRILPMSGIRPLERMLLKSPKLNKDQCIHTNLIDQMLLRPLTNLKLLPKRRRSLEHRLNGTDLLSLLRRRHQLKIE